jgi:hypothetical protein
MLGTSFKNLNNVKSYTPLDALTLNPNHNSLPEFERIQTSDCERSLMVPT